MNLTECEVQRDKLIAEINILKCIKRLEEGESGRIEIAFDDNDYFVFSSKDLKVPLIKLLKGMLDES